MSMCHPATDWSCSFTEEKLEELREDEKTAAALDRAEELGWYSLAALTGFRLGVCPTVVRPCAARCAAPGSWVSAPVGGGQAGALPLRTIGSSFTPHISGGAWLNSCGCTEAGDCSCSSISEVILPGPVGGIESVTIDGVILDQADYRVDGGNRLVRQDGGSWPICQDMSKSPADPDQEGVFEVAYYQGAAPSDMIRYAAGLLAFEFYQACIGKNCKLPRNVTNVARNGVTYDLEVGLFEGGFTRIPQVDAVIRIYNPHGAKSPARVLSPDAPARGRRQTWGVR